MVWHEVAFNRVPHLSSITWHAYDNAAWRCFCLTVTFPEKMNELTAASTKVFLVINFVVFALLYVNKYCLLLWRHTNKNSVTVAKSTHITKIFQQIYLGEISKWLCPIKLLKNDKIAVNTRVTEVYPGIPFSKNLYHIETSQLICIANQMTGFYML